jgi:hypothetical protein
VLRIIVRMKHHVIACDLDGTAAEYDGWKGGAIGAPIPGTVERVKRARAEGQRVWIFTARVSEADQSPEDVARARADVEAWCLEHIGEVLPVTATKLMSFSEFWDDKAIRVAKNGGELDRDAIGSLWRQLSRPATSTRCRPSPRRHRAPPASSTPRPRAGSRSSAGTCEGRRNRRRRPPEPEPTESPAFAAVRATSGGYGD